jgi:hypothetical protein
MLLEIVRGAASDPNYAKAGGWKLTRLYIQITSLRILTDTIFNKLLFP